MALRPSTWSYIGWGVLYLTLWLVPVPWLPLPEVFAATVVADFFINGATPFLLIGAGLVYALVTARTTQVPALVWPLVVGLTAVCVVVPLVMLLEVGGWLLLASTALVFSRAGWLLRRSGDARGVAMLLARGLLGPWLFMLPALGLSCLYMGSVQLGFANTDWMPLFGFVYFALEAVFEELMLRRSETQRLAPSSERP